MKPHPFPFPEPVLSWRQTGAQHRAPWYLGLAASAVLLAGCSTAPPQPPQPNGPVVQANRQAQALAELLDIARAATPRRYRAERAVSVRATLQDWADTAGLELQWKTPLDPSTSGIVDEFDLRRALMAMAQQFRDSQAALIVDLSNPKAIVVTQAQSAASHGSCKPLPAGAIALGQHCLAPLLAWPIDPSDAWLSESMKRWAQTAGLELVWETEIDWPITLSSPRRYGTDILQALTGLQVDLQSQGVHLHYTLGPKTLRLSASPVSAPIPGPSPAAQPLVQSPVKPLVHQSGIQP